MYDRMVSILIMHKDRSKSSIPTVTNDVEMVCSPSAILNCRIIDFNKIRMAEKLNNQFKTSSRIN